jgi:anti-anti-sigma factor
MEELAGELGFRRRRDEDSAVLSVTGAIDVATAPAFEREVFGALAEAPGALVIDLRRVNHLDSRGVHVLVRALRRARTSGVALSVCLQPGGVIRRVLDLSGLHEALPVVSRC